MPACTSNNVRCDAHRDTKKTNADSLRRLTAPSQRAVNRKETRAFSCKRRRREGMVLKAERMDTGGGVE